jgi:hypothetical protein
MHGIRLPLSTTKDRKIIGKDSKAKPSSPYYATYRAVGYTCSSSCSLLQAAASKGSNDPGCYALRGRVALHQRDSYSMDDGPRLYSWMMELPYKARVRHHISGDINLPSSMLGSLEIDYPYLEALLQSHRDRLDIIGWTYTHSWRLLGSYKALQVPPNLTINASCDSVEDTVEAKRLGWSITTVVAKGTPKRTGTLVVCPEQTIGIPCYKCMLCANPKRRLDVAFIAH